MQNYISYKSNKQYHIYFFLLFCGNQSRFYAFFPIEKSLILQDVIILIKSFPNIDKNHYYYYYYYKIFLEKFSNQSVKK